MHSILLLGAGKIGGAIAKLLSASGDYDVLVGDANQDALDRIAHWAKVRTARIDAAKPGSVAKHLRDRTAVISACSYSVNPGIAAAAKDAGASYFDLTEDVATTHAIRRTARGALDGQIFMPQCGLAPGFVAIAAHALTKQF